MAELKSETGSDAFGSFGVGIYIIVGLWFGLLGFELIGIRVPVDQPDGLRFAETIALGAVGCAILHLLLAGFMAFMQAMLTMAMTGLGVAVDSGEQFGSRLAHAAKLLLHAAARLALAPIVLPCRAFHARILAPILERRRQQAELHDLYMQVKDQYADFDAFLAAFNGEADTKAQEEAETREAPADAFADAAALFGLPADGAFTNAQFKAAFRTRMKEAHPDLAGDTALATELNKARDLINARKGWKR